MDKHITEKHVPKGEMIFNIVMAVMTVAFFVASAIYLTNAWKDVTITCDPKAPWSICEG